MKEKVFPSYMDDIELPEGACATERSVYRICRTGKVEADSFLTTFVEYKKGGRLQELDLSDVGSYSMSVYEKLRDAKRYYGLFSKREPSVIVAAGVTAIDCGVSQLTKEREPKRKNSHVDWWLYEGAKPYEHFEEVDVFADPKIV